MKRVVMTIVVVVSATVAFAGPVTLKKWMPGLIQGKFNSSWEIERPASSAEDSDVVSGPIATYAYCTEANTSFSDPITGRSYNWNAQNTTFAYSGYMYMMAGRTYTFAHNFDDGCYMKIDGKVYVSDSQSGNYKARDELAVFKPSETGWYAIEFRFADISGNKGCWGGSYWPNLDFSFGYRDDGSTSYTPQSSYKKLIDPGDGSLLRTGVAEDSMYFGRVVSAQMRANNPTIMDVDYVVFSDRSKEDVRVVAFKDGVRSFANIVLPETFADGTSRNVGDGVTVNVTNRISWQVSADWNIDLAKVRFEVLVKPRDLMPMHFVTIPATATHAAMKVSRNTLYEYQYFNALLWLYADKDANLQLSNGVLRNKSNNQELASGANVSGSTVYYDDNGNYVGSHWEINKSVPRYLFGKMGYSLLEGAALSYANAATRLGLSPSCFKQYAYKDL